MTCVDLISADIGCHENVHIILNAIDIGVPHQKCYPIWMVCVAVTLFQVRWGAAPPGPQTSR